ncbi:threonine--tRNA ligase [Candidatus Aenigmatarchaeota archaeon]
MKILLLHSDFIEWEPRKKAIKGAEEIEKKVSSVDEVLVVFSSVEKTDEGKERSIISKTSKEINKVAKEVKAKNIVIYPYVHLSTNPSSPASALKVLKGVEKNLKELKFDVYMAPFGYYKRFKISVKGHPLSELSREIIPEDGVGGEKCAIKGKKPEQDVSDAVKKESTLKSKWIILDPLGKEHPIEMKSGKAMGFNFSKHDKLNKMVSYEMAKSRLVKEEPPHIKLMRRLELVDYESGSDPGNFRFFPKGKLVKSLIEEWVGNKMSEYGAMEVETPIMYDYEHPVLKNYLNRFPARQYTIETPEKKVFLRFSACFGQFLMAKDSSISYRNLPMRMYEMTRYSFRVEQHGELAGLRRLRSFTMPDCHVMCRDQEEAKKEMMVRFGIANDVLKGLGLSTKKDIEFSIRVVKDFYDKNKAYVKKLVKSWGRPVLLEIWDKKFFYFIFKLEWNFVDALDKASCLSTDQIDVENAERYGIQFTDKDNKKKYPVILHQSPSGSIERVIYALLEKAYMDSKAGKNPLLPVWLSPVQARICPISDKFLPMAKKIADEMNKNCIRADVDDRVESVGKKIRNAEMEWVPYIIVIGDKEKKSGKLAVRFRESGNVKPMTSKQLIKHINEETKGFPYRPLPVDREMSKRPVFVG